MGGTVCLTFDFDAVSIWILRNMTAGTSISRGEFGAVAVPRFLHLLKKRGIESTWFVPGHTLETYPDICRRIAGEGHELALHGYTHENFNILGPEEEWAIQQRSYEAMKDLLGTAPKGFRSPSWEVSSRTVGFLKKLEIVYDSSQMGHDYSPYFCRTGDIIVPDQPMKFGAPSRVVEIPVAWSLDDYPYFEYVKTSTVLMPGLQQPRNVFANWTEDVRYMLRDFSDGVTVATIHPQVSGRGHRLLGLERWIDGLLDMGLQFSRMDAVAEEFLGGREFGRYTPE